MSWHLSQSSKKYKLFQPLKKHISYINVLFVYFFGLIHVQCTFAGIYSKKSLTLFAVLRGHSENPCHFLTISVLSNVKQTNTVKIQHKNVNFSRNTAITNFMITLLYILIYLICFAVQFGFRNLSFESYNRFGI